MHKVAIEFYPSPFDVDDLDIGDHAQAWENMRKVLEGLGKGFSSKALYSGTRGPDCYFEVETYEAIEEVALAFLAQPLVRSATWRDVYILNEIHTPGLRVHVPIEKQPRRRRR